MQKSVLASKYLWTFDVICFDFLRCANKECECSYQDAKNGIFNGLLLHKYSQDVASASPKAGICIIFIHQNFSFHQSCHSCACICHSKIHPMLDGRVCLYARSIVQESMLYLLWSNELKPLCSTLLSYSVQ